MKIPILLFMFLILVSSALAEDFSVSLIESIKDDSEKTENNVFSTACVYNSSKTHLLVELKTRKDYDDDGDVFQLIVEVTNVGKRSAIRTTVRLNDIPDDWKVYPKSKQKIIPFIKPGSTRKAIFLVKRGPTDATVYATAKAINSRKATSDSIPIPIFWQTTLLMSAAVASITLYVRRK